jgi:L-aminopeptidase/D-esterase-like protein
MAAVNAAGDIWDHVNGKLIAGARNAGGKGLADVTGMLRKGEWPAPSGRTPGALENTTLGCVATNATLTKAQARRVAIMASAGFSLAVRPSFTPFDGDTVFALATGKLKAPVDSPTLAILGALAGDLLAQSIASAVRHAKSIPGYPGLADLV